MPTFFHQLIATVLAFVIPPKKVEQPPSASETATAKPVTPLSSDLQAEIRSERPFSLAEAIGREGGSFLKGESTIPRPLRAIAAINQFLSTHLTAPSDALATTLSTWASQDIRVSRQLDTPLTALSQILDSLLSEPATFCEFARQVAIAHSQLTGDRPHFQQPGKPPHPDAEHTHDSIRQTLSDLQHQLQIELNQTALPAPG
ncbi:MAG: hypothetical protein AAFP20_03325 [Cyanobacteria bacterium J06614_10]